MTGSGAKDRVARAGSADEAVTASATVVTSLTAGGETEWVTLSEKESSSPLCAARVSGRSEGTEEEEEDSGGEAAKENTPPPLPLGSCNPNSPGSSPREAWHAVWQASAGVSPKQQPAGGPRGGLSSPKFESLCPGSPQGSPEPDGVLSAQRGGGGRTEAEQQLLSPGAPPFHLESSSSDCTGLLLPAAHGCPQREVGGSPSNEIVGEREAQAGLSPADASAGEAGVLAHGLEVEGRMHGTAEDLRAGQAAEQRLEGDFTQQQAEEEEPSSRPCNEITKSANASARAAEGSPSPSGAVQRAAATLPGPLRLPQSVSFRVSLRAVEEAGAKKERRVTWHMKQAVVW